jgi:hypothetical protein
MQEIWRSLPGHEDRYQISNLGRVLSRRGIRKTSLNSNGYPAVTLYRDGRRHTVKIHRAVAQLFVAGEAPGLDVCHIDGNKLNSAASNLRWDTRSENVRDQVRMGRHANARKTHCTHGHEYSPENTKLRQNGVRECRTCIRDRNKRDRSERRRLMGATA